MPEPSTSTSTKTPPRYRLLLGVVALFCVAVQFSGTLPLSAVALAIWLAALALFFRPALARLWMPRFWTISVVFAVGSGLLLGEHDVKLWGLSLSSAGLEAGLLMVVRGAFIFGLASWASQAFEERDIQRAARRLGAAWLGAALPSALRLLPELMEQYRLASAGASGPRLARGYEVAVLLMCHTARVAREMSEGPRIFRVALLGAPGSGKTTAALKLVRALEECGLRVEGVVQPATFEDQRRTGYVLRDVASQRQRSFAQKKKTADGKGLGYTFEPEGWQWASRRLQQARLEADVAVVDELGRLEARGEGHLPALTRPLDGEQAQVWLLGVRADAAEAIQQRLGPFHLQRTVDSGGDLVEDLVRRIVETVRGLPTTNE